MLASYIEDDELTKNCLLLLQHFITPKLSSNGTLGRRAESVIVTFSKYTP